MLVEFVASYALAAAPTFEAYLRSEVRAATTGEADAQLNPALTLKVPTGAFTFLTAYTPRLLLFEPNVPQKVAVLNNLRLAGELRTGKAGRLLLQEDLSYGDASFSWLVTAAEGGIPTFSSLAYLPIFKYVSEATTLAIEQPLSRKVGISLSGSYTISGGATAAAQQLSPLTHSPRVTARLVAAMGPHDALLTQFDGYAIYFPGLKTYAADAGLGWRHQFSTSTDGEILVGLSGGRSVSSVEIDNQLWPYFGLRVTKKFLQTQRQSIWGTLSLRILPTIDPITGVIYPAAESFGVLNYSPMSKVTLIFTLGGSISLSTHVHQNLGLAGATVAYELSQHVTLSGGARLFTFPSIYTRPLDQAPLNNQYQVTGLGFLAITLSERTRL